MSKRSIFFVPGKNPKPPEKPFKSLLWRTLLEGARRANPAVAENMSQHSENFKLIAWNLLYYQETKDISRDLSWIDALINQHGPTDQDILEANAQHSKIDFALFSIADIFPPFIRLLPRPARMTVQETKRYFHNVDNIACDVRELLKQELRPVLSNGDRSLVIGHSLGSVIAYDSLWELSRLEQLPGKIDVFLTIGSPLGMNYVQRQLMGRNHEGKNKFPNNIKRWVNISSEGDIVALGKAFCRDFGQMRDLGLVDSIEDHCEGIYNFFRNEEGLNPHRSYGYLVNPAVGKVISDWWQD